MSLNKNKIVKKMQEMEPKITTISTQQVQVSRYSGPIPDADELAKYEKIEPGFAARIISMSEYRSKHATEMEARGMELNGDYMRRSMNAHILGVIFGGLIGISCMATSAFVISIGAEWPGTILGVGGLGSLVSTFVYGTRMQQNSESKDMAEIK